MSRGRVPDERSDVLKGSVSQGPPACSRNTEYPSIRAREKRARRRLEMKQLREVWMNCTTDYVEASEGIFVLNPACD